MEAIDHAAMAVDALLISFLQECGLSPTPLNENRREVAKRMAAYAIFTYCTTVERDMGRIVFPPMEI